MTKKAELRFADTGDGLPACAALIAAGGEGLRLGGGVRKQFREIAGKTVLRHSLELFLGIPEIRRVVVVLPADSVGRFERGLTPGEKERVAAVAGGGTRQQSVRNGLAALDPEEIQVVAIHDAARPLVLREVVLETLRAAALGSGAIACAPVKDTVKRAGEDFVEGTLERRTLWLAQTPQTFPLAMILEAHRAAAEDGFSGTDDSALCERLGFPVRIVPSDPGNLKLTDSSDLAYLEYRLHGNPAAGPEKREKKMDLRVGEGYDIHPLAEGRKLILGGVQIPCDKGLAGHSDADVLLHAITDALLGAAALGDLGAHFPDTDPAFKGADSGGLLLQVKELLDGHGYFVLNVDATVIAEYPRLAPYIPEMRGRIAGILALDPDRVSVKATTHEGLGTLGRGEGIASSAVVLIGRDI
jgi:2-C-methyl-D-erythritol 4-phosphate cytidylyltransferase / 2-C-methyl-D-erythritol 2,4-cyclodiphosphate synthase